MSVDEEFLKAAEKAILERDKYRAQSEAKDQIIASKDEQLAALRALLEIQKTISKDWQEAATARKDALKIDDKMFVLYEKRVLDLQAERDSARRSRNTWTIGGFVVGAALALFAQK